jgi:glycolate oxidase iron-sulfur subunit
MVLLTGCVQDVLEPSINAATIRLLNRLGVEVIVPEAMGCCGSATQHMGKVDDANARARRNIDAWMPRWTARASTPSSQTRPAAAPR